MSEQENNSAPASPERSRRERDCQECYHQDEITGACKHDNCVDQGQFVPALGPADMFRTLYMVIYNLGGQVEVSAKDLATEGEMKIEHEFEPKTKKFILTCNPPPPEPTLIKVPKKLIKHRRKLILPHRN